MIIEDVKAAAEAAAWLVRCARTGASLPEHHRINLSPWGWWVTGEVMDAAWEHGMVTDDPRIAVPGARFAAALAAAGEGSAEIVVTDAALEVRGHRFKASLPWAEHAVEGMSAKVDAPAAAEGWRDLVAAAALIAGHSDPAVVAVCADGAFARGGIGGVILAGEATGDPVLVSRRCLDVLPDPVIGVAVLPGDGLEVQAGDRRCFVRALKVVPFDFRKVVWDEPVEGPVPADVVGELVDRARWVSQEQGLRWVDVAWGDGQMVLSSIARSEQESTEVASPVVAEDAGRFAVNASLLADMLKATGAPADLSLLPSKNTIDPEGRIVFIEGKRARAWLQTARR